MREQSINTFKKGTKKERSSSIFFKRIFSKISVWRKLLFCFIYLENITMGAVSEPEENSIDDGLIIGIVLGLLAIICMEFVIYATLIRKQKGKCNILEIYPCLTLFMLMPFVYCQGSPPCWNRGTWNRKVKIHSILFFRNERCCPLLFEWFHIMCKL